MRRILFILVALALPAWGDSTVKIGDIVWYQNYNEAMAVAQERGLPLWLHFGENPG
jgi:hypothetical protein